MLQHYKQKKGGQTKIYCYQSNSSYNRKFWMIAIQIKIYKEGYRVLQQLSFHSVLI